MYQHCDILIYSLVVKTNGSVILMLVCFVSRGGCLLPRAGAERGIAIGTPAGPSNYPGDIANYSLMETYP